ncbi:MAG: GspH/FimT family pseudopilin [Henriciella sp.]|nr:GspH/FimT family pseudopilin [Henriciella sp.]MBO6695853.1 GspH/FimT family pseudopilin [Henriciella sp.]
MTLVEVMTVLFIIGLTAGIVTLTLPQRPTEEQASAQAFATVLRNAQDQAIFAGQPLGLQLTDRGYTLVQWRQDGWRPQGRPVLLPRAMEISVETEERARPDSWPELVFDPTGIVQPAEFQLRARGVRIDISLLETGEVVLVER